MRVIGIGDNVCDKYEHLKTMFPGGQALNFAAYAKMLGPIPPTWVSLEMTRQRLM